VNDQHADLDLSSLHLAVVPRRQIQVRVLVVHDVRVFSSKSMLRNMAVFNK
jgi:hypothetical protein